MSKIIIEAKKLGYKTGKKHLLKDITWNVQQGEHWAVYGLNGSGKTTLLSIIAGYKMPTSGELNILGDTYTQSNGIDLRKKIGWVSGSFYDKNYTKESVLDIILSGKTGTLSLGEEITLEDIKLVKKLAAELHILDKLNYGFDMLSKGQRQNVMIARALIAKPQILILDEPCNGLDVYHREYLFSTLRKLAKMWSITLIYVTHYMDEIIDLFSHVLLLKDGKVFASGTTDELFTDGHLTKFLNYEVSVCPTGENTKKISLNVDSKIDQII